MLTVLNELTEMGKAWGGGEEEVVVVVVEEGEEEEEEEEEAGGAEGEGKGEGEDLSQKRIRSPPRHGCIVSLPLILATRSGTQLARSQVGRALL